MSGGTQRGHGLTARALGGEDVDLWRRMRAEGLRLFPGAVLVTAEETAAADREAMARGGRFGFSMAPKRWGSGRSGG